MDFTFICSQSTAFEKSLSQSCRIVFVVVQMRQKAKIFQGLVDYVLLFRLLDPTSPVTCLFQAAESIMERSNAEEMTEVPERPNEDSWAIVDLF